MNLSIDTYAANSIDNVKNAPYTCDSSIYCGHLAHILYIVLLKLYNSCAL